MNKPFYKYSERDLSRLLRNGCFESINTYEKIIADNIEQIKKRIEFYYYEEGPYFGEVVVGGGLGKGAVCEIGISGNACIHKA